MPYQSLSSYKCSGERSSPYPHYGSNIPERRLRQMVSLPLTKGVFATLLVMEDFQGKVMLRLSRL